MSIYTKEVTEKLALDFKAGAPTKSLADQLGVPERSVIAKLSSMGLYSKKPYVNKRGEVPIRKDAYVEQIADLLGVDFDIIESLEKANKQVLKLIYEALKPQDQ